jgi:enoyl-CoA hydratase/carnithine racemase
MTWRLPRLVRMRLAQDIILTNRRVTSEEPVAIGLISRVVGLAAETPNRSATARRDMPPSTAWISLIRKFSERLRHACWPPAQGESDFAIDGNLEGSVRSRGRREPRALSGVRPHRSRIERAAGSPEQRARFKADGRRRSPGNYAQLARYGTDVAKWGK